MGATEKGNDMTSSPNTQPIETHEPLDLAALGRMWKPPQEVDMTPEVSDIIAEMPWWAARGLVYIIVGFIIVGLLWAHFSVLDIIVESRGALVPEGYVRPVQAAVSGVVQYALAREGETVERGQALIQLDATEQRTRLSKLREELATNEEQLRQLRAARVDAAQILEKQNRVAQLESDITALELALKHTTITAPTSGIIATLDVRSAGAVVQAGQKVATIVPEGTRLVAEAQVPNKDIAFIQAGLPVRLKLDAFPFQDYGSVPGMIIEVSPDAQADPQLGSFYKVTIAPQKNSIVAKGKEVPLRPGMTLTAEIITERKSILNLILAPFRELRSKAGAAK